MTQRNWFHLGWSFLWLKIYYISIHIHICIKYTLQTYHGCSKKNHVHHPFDLKHTPDGSHRVFSGLLEELLEKPDATRLRSLVMELKALAEEQRLGRMAVGTVGRLDGFRCWNWRVWGENTGVSSQVSMCEDWFFSFETGVGGGGGWGWLGGEVFSCWVRSLAIKRVAWCELLGSVKTLGNHDEKNCLSLESRDNGIVNHQLLGMNPNSKKSPTGPTERTPKPEYLIALATYLGVRW